MSTAAQATHAERTFGPEASVATLARRLAAFALINAGFFLGCWLVLGREHHAWLLSCMRPDIALVECLLAAVTCLPGGQPVARTALRRLLCAAVVAIGSFHFACSVRGVPISLLAALNPSIVVSQPLMVPLAALVAVLSGLAIGLGTATASRPLQAASFAGSAAAFIAAAGCLAAAGFHWLMLEPADCSHVLMPGSATGLLAIHGSHLASHSAAPGLHRFFDGHPASRLGRRLLSYTSFSILLFTAAAVALVRNSHLLLQESCALLVFLALALVAVFLHRHVQSIRQLMDREASQRSLLEQSLAQRAVLVDQLEQERARLQGIFDAAVGYSIITTDPAGTINFFSAGAEELTGYRAADMVGKQTPLVLHDHEELKRRAELFGLPIGFDLFRALPNLRQSDANEWTYITATGKRIPTFVSVTAMRNSKQEIAGYLGITRGLSTEKNLARERDAFLNIGQELLCTADLALCTFKSVSSAFERTMGYGPNELVGSSFLDFVHPQDREKTINACSELEDGVRIQRFENRWRHKNGSYRWISWDAFCSREENLLYASGWDVTDEKIRTEKVSAMLQNEQRLIGIVSHDLRNPLGAISMSAQLVQRQRARPEQVDKHAARILTSCARAERLIHGILDLTKSRRGEGLAVERDAIDLVEITRHSAEEVQLAHPGASLLVTGIERAPLLGDKDRLFQVFTNLLTNACKYSPTGSPVRLTVDDAPEDVVVRVHNLGEPIPPGSLSRIFQPLQRASSAGSNEGNIGLGLYIVSQIVRGHGGSIDVESAHEVGTTFRVTLPKQPGPGA